MICKLNGLKSTNTLYLSDFPGADDKKRIVRALDEARRTPGTTLVIEPGIYTITTESSRDICESLLRGDYGADPEKVMFSSDFPYDRGIDLAGHDGTTIDGTGARLLIDGFMEDISVRDCRGVTVRGFEIDNTRRPYTKAVISSVSLGVASARLSSPICEKTPIVRTCIYSHDLGRFIPEICDVGAVLFLHGDDCEIALKGDASRVKPGDEIYLCHTFHFRPSVLIENAKDVTVKDVTVHAHAGMALTAFHAENVTLDGFRVVPSEGEHFSTNTDATHFTSCRGYLRIENCEFEGQGDDGINVHTYYYTPVSSDGRTVKLEIMSPTWTHTQKMDSPAVGDRFELCRMRSLETVDTFRVISSEVDERGRTCTVTLDRDVPGDLEDYLFADPDETPRLEVVNCSFRNHFARGMTLKARTCYIEKCEMTDVFELPIKLAAEAYWHEGVSCDEMTVKDCCFTNCGRLKYCVPKFECGGIEVFTDAPEHAPSHGKVTLIGNVIECPECDHGIMLRDVRSSVLSGNKVVSKKEPIIK